MESFTLQMNTKRAGRQRDNTLDMEDPAFNNVNNETSDGVVKYLWNVRQNRRKWKRR